MADLYAGALEISELYRVDAICPSFEIWIAADC